MKPTARKAILNNLVVFLEVVPGAEQLDIVFRYGTPSLGPRQIVVKMQLICCATHHAPAFVALPHG
jgi:hypothetical protein